MPYLMSFTSYDCGFWHRCVRWYSIFFFHFYQNSDFSCFLKFINKCQKEILRCAPPSSHLCDFFFLKMTEYRVNFRKFQKSFCWGAGQKLFIFFNADMLQVFGTLLFFQQTFLEATCISYFCTYPSAEIPGYDVFSDPSWGLKHSFLEGSKVFCIVVMKDKSLQV